MISNHTQLLNFLAEKIQAKSYLEIGVSNRANNFDKINIQYRVGVDPNPRALANFCGTSDEFFSIQSEKFDLVFIDGLHHADQVEKDFNSALRVLNSCGYIILHDTNPESEHLTHVPRDKKGRWLGDVYKFAISLNEYINIQFVTINIDNGCTVVWKSKEWKIINEGFDQEKTWEYFTKNRNLLRLVSPEKFVQNFSKLSPVLVF